MRHRHGRHCGCNSCKTIVHPTKYNCVDTFSQSTVNHVHPSHTTVTNHHLVKNNHFFPHSTSFQNTTNSVDAYGGSFQVPGGPGQVAGAMSPGYGQGGQVAGAMSPGYGQGGYGQGGQVAGSMSPGYGHGNHNCKKPQKWC
ncbi:MULTISPECIES: spore coat protein [Oceanobacillus]|uniref:Spore coat protein n=1 Tax=Oceanobacillus profundus TaxID=372463 RepID=A0A417YL99_9BACI|nr:spore coat protein [Oceanobacillus profundus]MBR3121814.1 spore coat protein [Oceanobacillus sp.]MCM3399260.1 spore coat protein [Oceanobacillus profundus]PAE29412.1 spore coat protein [Paenibacillus sp. 7884-2]RHW34230.1 spore coat protein [Oceanobacillus profundus]